MRRSTRPFLTLCSVVIVALLALGNSGARATGTAPKDIASIGLSAAGHPDSAVDVSWYQGVEPDGALQVGLESRLYEITVDDALQPVRLRLQVRPARPTSRVAVRQRSVTYLNIGDEGPHTEVTGSDARGPWVRLQAGPDGAFAVLDAVAQPIDIRRPHIVAAMAEQPRWRALFEQCQSANDGACYTVTDTEFEVTVTTAGGGVTRKIVRVIYPNGC